MRRNGIAKAGPWALAGLLVLPAACAERTPPRDDAAIGDAGLPDTALEESYIEGSERVWEAARQRGVVFRAVGQEPGWLLEIDHMGGITLLTDYGADTARATVPQAEVAQAAGPTTYVASTDAGELRIEIRAGPCSDTMSGERFSRTVAVTLAGTEYRGCGRPLPPAQ